MTEMTVIISTEEDLSPTQVAERLATVGLQTIITAAAPAELARHMKNHEPGSEQLAILSRLAARSTAGDALRDAEQAPPAPRRTTATTGDAMTDDRRRQLLSRTALGQATLSDEENRAVGIEQAKKYEEEMLRGRAV